MKKHSLLLASLGLSAIFAACVPEVDAVFDLSDTSFEIPAEGGEVSFSITANVSWVANSSADWLAISPASGDKDATVKISAQANESENAREARVSVVSSESTLEVVVKQAGKKVDPKPELPDGALAGAYSVSASKKVLFSKGNLAAAETFAQSQEEAGMLMLWSEVNDAQFGDWFALSADEWDYLFHGRADADKKCGFATLNGMYGIAAMPDDHSGSLDASKGAFLPACGYAYGNVSAGAGEGGSYWSSDKNSGIDFDASELYTKNASLDIIKQAVRLVMVAPAE